METPQVLAAEGVRKRYGDVLALDGVSFELRRGEILGLVGPNGAGKTTFLKAAVGLVRLKEGRILVDGLDVGLDPVGVRRRAGYLPGECNLYPGMTGKGFLDFCLAGYPGVDSALRDDLVARFELPLRKKVRKHSTGMRRKLLLVQALCPRTPLALLDEPTESLDPSSRLFLLSLLRRLAGEGRAIVFSSHQLDEVERICDRVALLHRGKLLDFAPIDSLRERAARLPPSAFDYRSVSLTKLYAALYGVKA